MSGARNDDPLSGRRHVVVLLRLVLGGGGELSHGEIVDVAGRPRGRFGDGDGLVPALRSWLDDERTD